MIKKKISKFLIGEESKIPRKALVGLGVALATVGIAAAAQTHTSSTSLSYLKPSIRGIHTSHTSASSTSPTSTVHTSTAPTTTTTGSEPGCFLGESLIETPNSLVKISNLKIDGIVLGFYKNGDIVENEVKKIFTFKRNQYYILKTKNSEVKVTAGHPFYTGNGYKTTKELKRLDYVYIISNGKLVKEKIISKKCMNEKVTVYNLQVSNTNTFFANHFAVHNKC